MVTPTSNRILGEPVFRGQVVYVDSNVVIGLRGAALWKSSDSGASWHRFAVLPYRLPRRLCLASRLLERASRLGVKSWCVAGDNLVLFSKGIAFMVELESGAVHSLDQSEGIKPPLCVGDQPGTTVFFGEYSRNPEREPMRIVALDAITQTMQIVSSVSGIRHIHGTYALPESDHVLLTTGDLDHECGIWSFSPKAGLTGQLVGSQHYRAVYLHISSEMVYFGTDCPGEENFIFSWRLGSKDAPQCLQRVGGPVFFGAKVGDVMVLSTACEPSAVNRIDAIELWLSAGGGNWVKFVELRKDCLPMRYLGYGLLRFPSGPGDGKNLWVSTYAVAPDNTTYRVPQSKMQVALESIAYAI